MPYLEGVLPQGAHHLPEGDLGGEGVAVVHYGLPVRPVPAIHLQAAAAPFQSPMGGQSSQYPSQGTIPQPSLWLWYHPCGIRGMRQDEDIHLGMDGGREKWMDSGKEKLGLASPKGTLLLGMAMPLVVLGASGREQPIT